MKTKLINSLTKIKSNKKKSAGLRKKTVKGLVCFLVLMIAFTILSRAADAMTIPSVMTSNVQKGTIDRKISASGKVEKNRDQAVSTVSGLKVKSLNVKEGERVSAGDILFELDPEDLMEQITKLEQEIRIMDLEADDNERQSNKEANTEALRKKRALEDYNRALETGNKTVTDAYEKMIAAEKVLNDYRLGGNAAALESLRQDYELKEELLRDAIKQLQQIEAEIEQKIADAVAKFKVDYGYEPDENEQWALENEVTLIYGWQLSEAMSFRETAQAERDAALVAWEKKQTDDEMLTQLTTDYNLAREAYERAVEDHQDSLTTTNRALEDANQPITKDNSDLIAGINKETKMQDLEKLKRLKEQAGIVKAPVDAIVTEIGISVGGTTGDGMAILLADLSEGAVFTTQITEEEQKFLSRDDLVTLQTVDGKTIKDLAILSMQASKENPGMIDVTILLTEDQIEIGSYATMTFIKKSEVYSQCIKRSALHGDATEYYVYIIRENESILGSQLVAEKVVVSVLDQHGDYAAIGDSLIDANTQIITDSEKVIEAGDRVRLGEE